MGSVCDSVTSHEYNILTYFGTGTSYNPDRAEVGMSKKIFEYRKPVNAASGKFMKKEVDAQQKNGEIIVKPKIIHLYN